MNEKNFEKYVTELKEINEKGMNAYKEKNIYKLIDLYGDIKFINGYLISESKKGFNEEINTLYEESLTISSHIYSSILDIL